LYGSTITFDAANVAVSGETLLQMQAEMTSEVTARFSASTASKKILCFWGGANDYGAGATSATVWTRYTDYITAFKAANPGVRIIGFTLIKIKGGVNPNFDETDRGEFNTSLLASVGTVVDAVVDAGAAAQLQDPTDLTYWNADGVHLNNAGNTVVAALAKTKLDLFL
jgi:lysophospholipase L1-like esterase